MAHERTAASVEAWHRPRAALLTLLVLFSWPSDALPHEKLIKEPHVKHGSEAAELLGGAALVEVSSHVSNDYMVNGSQRHREGVGDWIQQMADGVKDVLGWGATTTTAPGQSFELMHAEPVALGQLEQVRIEVGQQQTQAVAALSRAEAANEALKTIGAVGKGEASSEEDEGHPVSIGATSVATKFVVGDRVVSEDGAKGTVATVDEDGDPEVRIDGLDGGPKQFYARDFKKMTEAKSREAPNVSNKQQALDTSTAAHQTETAVPRPAAHPSNDQHHQQQQELQLARISEAMEQERSMELMKSEVTDHTDRMYSLSQEKVAQHQSSQELDELLLKRELLQNEIAAASREASAAERAAQLEQAAVDAARAKLSGFPSALVQSADKDYIAHRQLADSANRRLRTLLAEQQDMRKRAQIVAASAMKESQRWISETRSAAEEAKSKADKMELANTRKSVDGNEESEKAWFADATDKARQFAEQLAAKAVETVNYAGAIEEKARRLLFNFGYGSSENNDSKSDTVTTNASKPVTAVTVAKVAAASKPDGDKKSTPAFGAIAATKQHISTGLVPKVLATRKRVAGNETPTKLDHVELKAVFAANKAVDAEMQAKHAVQTAKTKEEAKTAESIYDEAKETREQALQTVDKAKLMQRTSAMEETTRGTADAIQSIQSAKGVRHDARRNNDVEATSGVGGGEEAKNVQKASKTSAAKSGKEMTAAASRTRCSKVQPVDMAEASENAVTGNVVDDKARKDKEREMRAGIRTVIKVLAKTASTTSPVAGVQKTEADKDKAPNKVNKLDELIESEWKNQNHSSKPRPRNRSKTIHTRVLSSRIGLLSHVSKSKAIRENQIAQAKQKIAHIRATVTKALGEKPIAQAKQKVAHIRAKVTKALGEKPIAQAKHKVAHIRAKVTKAKKETESRGG